ncbi:MAG: hypothetical protein EHM36_12615 [Deltaproteobacteria bacterium]|nr:MAG: hypothetical protein EHM36_12615 [Deltaproteobacteria bacterium]
MIGKTCKFYLDSMCLLKQKFCDLNCNQMFYEDDSELSQNTESPTRWQTENKEMERVWSKWR